MDSLDIAHWTLPMDYVDIVHGFSGQSGQCPWTQWTNCREFGQTGQCPWTLPTESMDKVQGTVDNVHALTGQSPRYVGYCLCFLHTQKAGFLMMLLILHCWKPQICILVPKLNQICLDQPLKLPSLVGPVCQYHFYKSSTATNCIHCMI